MRAQAVLTAAVVALVGLSQTAVAAKKKADPKAAASAKAAAPAKKGGTISGQVKFEGTPPTPAMQKRTSDPVCAKSAAEAPDQSIAVSGGGLANVVIRLTNGPAAEKAPTAPVIVDQKECSYEPRVQVALEGQQVEVRNDDNTLHNVHAYTGTKGYFNQAQPPKAAPITKPQPPGSDVMKMKCDVHPWMVGYVVFAKSPYTAVTDKDGKFSIEGVPAGTYTVEAWHEKLGTKTAQVTIADGKSADPAFSFAAAK